MTPFGNKVLLALLFVFIASGMLWYFISNIDSTRQINEMDTASSTPLIDVHESNDTPNVVTLSLGESRSTGDISIQPIEVVEDSRCPKDVQCIQAGRVRVLTLVTLPSTSTRAEFTIGEPVIFLGGTITLVEVTPEKVSTQTIKPADYKFMFRVDSAGKITYINASPSDVVVATPNPTSVVGKEFLVKGLVKGPWYFEGTFPVRVVDATGKVLVSTTAKAEDDWMTEKMVPFTATVQIELPYTGEAQLVLENDNPSGDPARSASISFPVYVEY